MMMRMAIRRRTPKTKEITAAFSFMKPLLVLLVVDVEETCITGDEEG